MMYFKDGGRKPSVLYVQEAADDAQRGFYRIMRTLYVSDFDGTLPNRDERSADL